MQDQYSAITRLKRTIWYAPRHNSAVSMLDVQLSPSDWLEGWTPEQAASSGLIPHGMVVEGDLHNVFSFETIWEHLKSENFSITTPTMEIDGNAIDKKIILFRRVEKKVLHDPFCS